MSPLITDVAACILLGGAAVFTLALAFVQLRAPWKGLTDAGRRPLRLAAIACCTGMGATAGALIAVETAGPGALAWMWVTWLLAMALAWVEVRLAADAGASAEPKPEALSAATTFASLGGAGRAVGMIHGLAALVVVLALGAAFQVQQAGEVLGPLLDVEAKPVAIGMALLAAPYVLFGERKRMRERVMSLVPPSVMIWSGVLLLTALQLETSVGETLGAVIDDAARFDRAAAGGAGGLIGIVVSLGAMRGIFGAVGGLGLFASLPGLPGDRDAKRAAAAALAGPLAGVVVATLTGVVALGSAAQGQLRLDDAELRNEEGKAQWLFAERPHVRAAKPSMEHEQTIVLPVDTPLEAGNAYPMVFRSNPRGHRLGRLVEEQNAIVLGYMEVAANVDTIVFRDADPVRRKDPAYDLRLEVRTEILTADSGARAIKIVPTDPDVVLRKLRTRRQGPYLDLDDFHFMGTVAKAFSPDEEIGEHLAMYEERAEDAEPNPPLRTILELGFRGPYFDEERPRGPMAMVGAEGADLEPGDRVTLEYVPTERGLDIGRVIHSDLVTPAWDFLAGSTHAILRHKENPAEDLRVPVDMRVEDGWLHFTSADPNLVDFAKHERMRLFTGPYLDAPPYRFDVEARTGARLPDPPGVAVAERGLQEGPLASRAALVPVHELAEPRGGDGEIYSPHPAEVARHMEGPFLVEGPTERLARSIRSALGPAGTVLGALGAALATLLSLVVWGRIGESIGVCALGPSARMAFRVVFAGACLAGAFVAAVPLLDVITLGCAAAIVLNVPTLAAMIRRARAS